MWLGCSLEPLYTELLTSVYSQLHFCLNKPSWLSQSQYTSVFYSSPHVHFHSGDSRWIPRPSLEKLSLTFILVQLASFVLASQDLSSSPTLKTADSGFSEQSLSLLSAKWGKL